MKNILIVATTSYAGMGPYVSEIVNTFHVNDGVFFLFRDYEDNFFRDNIKTELHPICYFYKWVNSNWNKLKALLGEDGKFVDILYSLCIKYKINVVHFLCDPTPVDIAKKLESKGIEVIGTVHDLHAHEAKKAFHKMLKHRISEKHRWNSTQYGKILITNSVSQFEELKRLFPDKKIYYHAFPSLVTKKIAEGTDVPSELLNLDKPYILFFGRIEEYKGLSILYDAYVSDKKLIDNYYLVIAGTGEINIEGINRNKGVILMNRYIKDSEIRYLYEHSKCVVYPYLSATQSGVLSLSFYFGKPTVASDIPFFNSIIAPNKAGLLFKNGSSDDLCDKLKKILSADTSEMEEKAKNIYTILYETSSIRERLLEIYNHQA